MRKERIWEKKTRFREGKRLEEMKREELGCNTENIEMKEKKTTDEAREEDEMK